MFHGTLKRQSRHSLFALDEKDLLAKFLRNSNKVARVDHGTVAEATEDDCQGGSRPQGGSKINVPKAYVFRPSRKNIVPSI